MTWRTQVHTHTSCDTYQPFSIRNEHLTSTDILLYIVHVNYILTACKHVKIVTKDTHTQYMHEYIITNDVFVII